MRKNIMIRQTSAIVMALALAGPAAASSDDAWTEFVADVQLKCLAATQDMLDNATIAVDPVGSENFGLAIVSGKAKGADARISHICVYNKQNQSVEIGGELTDAMVKVDIQPPSAN
jgi:hypothetical protein